MNIIKNRNIFFIISISIIVVGMLFMMINGLNRGIDFTGGALLQIDFNQEIDVNEIREITDTFDAEADIIHAGEENKQIIIKTKLDLDKDERNDIFDQFKVKYGLNDKAFIQSKLIGPSIGKEIQNKAYLSILVATIGMLIYITYRFEFTYGIAAVIALIHDVLITLSVFTVFQLPVTTSFVAGILTIVGYSINDTIVLFDRIRENVKYMKKRDYKEVVNTSISQTISRSINTSFTTLLAITTLYVFGVEAIKDFALPLIVGILAGTYSSIFIASPVWYIIKSKKA